MDCIAAISTAQTATAIGIVRISGEGCFALCDAVFRAGSGKGFSDLPPRKMVYGQMLDDHARIIDQGLAVRFPGPNSFTGEDCAEFHCHGSPVVLRELLSALFTAGARQAGPGEFTRRAFLNGRMDLTEAEAVIDLIDAETPAAARNAAAQLGGALYRLLQPVEEALLDITSRFYAVVDYPDEDIEDIDPQGISAALDTSAVSLSRLLGTARRGRVLKSGVRTAIVGRPNAGKSSLLNLLAGYDRAIVTDLPGTTRDTVEESVLCGEVQLRLIDTAGIRESTDMVEQLGVERSRQAMESAQLVLMVLDQSQEVTEEDIALLQDAAAHAPTLLLLNKTDLPSRLTWQKALDAVPHFPISAKTGEGIEALEEAIAALYPAGAPEESGTFLTDLRQEEAVRRALEAIGRAKEALRAGFTPDAILTDAEEALSALGELTGRTAKEEIVGRIFSRFCVGK